MESRLALISIAVVTVASGGTVTINTLTVDLPSRPGIQSLVEGLMPIAILGAGALVLAAAANGVAAYFWVGWN
jgi:hypothetical protein